MRLAIVTAPREINVGKRAGNRADQQRRRGQDLPDDEAPKGMADRTGHVRAYEVFEISVKAEGLKNCDLGRKGAKVVKSPKVLKMGVNSPVTARIYA